MELVIKIEDFGVGFYTKYGDGGVDISPIGDCKKTEVWELGRELKYWMKLLMQNQQMDCGMMVEQMKIN